MAGQKGKKTAEAATSQKGPQDSSIPSTHTEPIAVRSNNGEEENLASREDVERLIKQENEEADRIRRKIDTITKRELLKERVIELERAERQRVEL